MRPTRILPGIDAPLKRCKPEDLNWVIVRENSEGEYAGVGGRVHQGLPIEVATDVSMMTRAGVRAHHALRLQAGAVAPAQAADGRHQEQRAAPRDGDVGSQRRNTQDDILGQLVNTYEAPGRPWPCRARHRGPRRNRCHYSPRDGIIAAVQKVATGLAIPLPVMSMFEPIHGSYVGRDHPKLVVDKSGAIAVNWYPRPGPLSG